MATAAEDQLRLEIPVEEVAITSSAIDLVSAHLAAHGGNHRSAIEALLLDADFLRDQLYTASCLMSQGMSRGWRPKYERV